MNHRRLDALKEEIKRSGVMELDDNISSEDGIVETATLVIQRLIDQIHQVNGMIGEGGR